MKLSIVILCWNDQKVIQECLRSIYAGTHATDFEVLISDNGSTDGSPEFIRQNFPQARVIENGANLRFAKGNNVGISASRGEYVLILNPDTIIHDGALDQIVRFADQHPGAGAFGCRVLNPDGSYQESGRPFPSIRGEWVVAFYLRPLARLSGWFLSDTYTGWNGDSERPVDWLSGCFILARRDVLQGIEGFDEQFFYYYEDIDLCRRIRQAGYSVLFTPAMAITHLGGQSTRRAPLKFHMDSQVTRYRYFYKYYGPRGAQRARRVALVALLLRRMGYGLLQLIRPTEDRRKQLETLRVTFDWNLRADPVQLAGKDPGNGIEACAVVNAR